MFNDSECGTYKEYHLAAFDSVAAMIISTPVFAE